jgi:5'-nucleotidase
LPGKQQWLDPKRPRILQVSKGFNYAWDYARPYGDRIVADRMSLNGQRIDPATGYRVTVNNYLAVGGDGFTVLKEGSGQQFGIYDVDALHGYFQANSPISPPAAGRIVRLN